MNRVAGIKDHKPNLKLVLCLLGIIFVIAILMAMWPLPGNKNSEVAATKSATAKGLSAGNIKSVAQASAAVQTATSTGLASASSPQTAQVNYSSSNSSAPVSVPPSEPTSQPPANPDVVLYPRDPIPCKHGGYMPYCGTCEPYPTADGQAGSCPRCYGGGVEIMCANPL